MAPTAAAKTELMLELLGGCVTWSVAVRRETSPTCDQSLALATATHEKNAREDFPQPPGVPREHAARRGSARDRDGLLALYSSLGLQPMP